MYAITGITGQVGAELGKQLLAAGLPVRAVVRDAAKGADWAARGAEVALADLPVRETGEERRAGDREDDQQDQGASTGIRSTHRSIGSLSSRPWGRR